MSKIAITYKNLELFSEVRTYMQQDYLLIPQIDYKTELPLCIPQLQVHTSNLTQKCMLSNTVFQYLYQFKAKKHFPTTSPFYSYSSKRF